MAPRNLLNSRSLVLIVAASALCSSGCAALELSGLTFAKDAPSPPKVAPGTPTFVAELRAEGIEPRKANVPLPRPMVTSEALALVKAEKHFQKYDAHIMRQTPTGTLRLPIIMEGASGRVSPSSDYSIHPDDRLVIVKNSRSGLEEMTDQVMRPFGFLRR